MLRFGFFGFAAGFAAGFGFGFAAGFAAGFGSSRIPCGLPAKLSPAFLSHLPRLFSRLDCALLRFETILPLAFFMRSFGILLFRFSSHNFSRFV